MEYRGHGFVVLLKINFKVFLIAALFHVLESEQLEQGAPTDEKQLRSCQLPSFSYGSNEVSPQHVNVLLQINCNYCNYILFTKFPWPGNSEGTFPFGNHATICPMPTCLLQTVKALHCSLLLLKVKQ